MSSMYSPDQLISVARRVGNPRRSYLIVNPLQGKHLPVSPGEMLEMVRCLAAKVQRISGSSGTVIGMAETATAVGAALAQTLPESFYVQTTREFSRPAPPGRWLDFTEDHSHARTQALFAGQLEEPLRGGALILVDDEVSTGRTCLHLVSALRDAFGRLPDRVILASMIGRLLPEDRRRLLRAGIEPISLLEVSHGDYEHLAAQMTVQEAGAREPGLPLHCTERRLRTLPDPRFGVRGRSYELAIRGFLREAGPKLAARLPQGAVVSVLGTEECMYPAIRLGSYLEEAGDFVVRTHSTTRSPIGVGSGENYPIHAGHRLRSFYDPERLTFLYNPVASDAVIVVTDAGGDPDAAMADIGSVYRPFGTADFTLLRV